MPRPPFVQSMEISSDGRAVAFGLFSAGSALVGLLVSQFIPMFLPAAAWLVFAFAIAPALAVLLAGTLVARVLGIDALSVATAAAGAFLGGALAVVGSILVPGLFLFVGWFLFPWTFAYAGAVLPHLLRLRSARGGTVALHLGVATALYVPWIGFTLFRAFDVTAERAGFREGAGWIENFPSAVVVLILYVLLATAAFFNVRSPRFARAV